jgi:hypothetical protein
MSSLVAKAEADHCADAAMAARMRPNIAEFVGQQHFSAGNAPPVARSGSPGLGDLLWPAWHGQGDAGEAAGDGESSQVSPLSAVSVA